MTHALSHLKVIDAASYLAGPGAATVLADYGADVIKIEPLMGDGYRLLVGPHPVPYHWQLTSRNKRSLALDLRKPEGQEVFRKLVSDADVLLSNFRPDQLEKFNMGWEEMSALNERLIMAQITGYGAGGPDSEMRAFDMTAWWARSGMMDYVREPGQLPQHGSGGSGDHSTAMSMFGAIMMGLYQRELTGKGSFVSTSLVANGVWAHGMMVQGKFAGVDAHHHRQEKGMPSPLSAVYQAADERYFLMVITDPRKEWPKMVSTFGDDSWFDTWPTFKEVFRNKEAVREKIAGVTATLTWPEIRQRLTDNGIAFSLIQNLDDIANDEHLKAVGVIVPTASDNPDYQWTVSSPIEMAGEEKLPPHEAPDIGAHSHEILSGLGYTDDDINRLSEAGVTRL